MKALWRHDWYRSKRIMLMTSGAVYLMILLQYIILELRHRFVFLYDGADPLGLSGNLLTIWLLPVVVTFIQCKTIDDDMNSGWYKTCMGMPLTSRQYVDQKFLYGIAFGGAGIAYVMIVNTIFNAVFYSFDLWQTLLFFSEYLMVFLIMSSVSLFISLWKGFGYALLFWVLLLLVIPLIISLFLGAANDRTMINVYSDFLMKIRWLFLEPEGKITGAVASAILYALSYFLCLAAAKRRLS